MIWLNPAAWIGLVVLAAPIVIHILVQRRAERLAFPSLRFLPRTRLASIRRHVLDDLPLLALRAAIVAGAVAALAGPLIVTPGRRQVWNARVVRAIVVEDLAAAGDRAPAASALQPPAFLSQTFETRTLPDGLHRALVWLENAPPARRELVIIGPLALGSLIADDLSAVPPGIGVRFERLGTLPEARTVDGGEVLDGADTRVGPYVRPVDAHPIGSVSSQVGADPRVRPRAHRQVVTLSRDRTSVTETGGSDPRPMAIEIVSASTVRPIVDLAIAAVVSQRVWAPAENRRGRLVLGQTSIDPSAIADVGPIVEPSEADAVASMVRDRDLQAAGSHVPTGLSDTRFALAPWQRLLSASDGRPLVVAAASNTSLVVVSGAEPADLVTPLLLRAMLNALGGPPDLRQAEVLPISDAQLKAWSRPASPVAAPRIDRIERNDRRGLWVLVLVLLALETWIRRSRAAGASAHEENARVA